jgi:leucyl/phenylalanyl-tRNA--protein transferase
MHFLDERLIFPPPETASRDGILAIGGDLSPERLEIAYHNGIFPWFSEGEPILWWCPPKRMAVFPDTYRPPKSLRSALRKSRFEITFNRDFEAVIRRCRAVKRAGQDGTWLSEEMVEAYLEMHARGWAKSVEAWLDGELAGGLYGVDLGHVFTGESMFSDASGASKAAFAWLVEKLKSENYKLLDCQVHNHHLELLGAAEIPRKDFLAILHHEK